ncbi:MAG: FGGY-family carbohydrate kinase [Synechococcales cyanobacterium]
MNERVGTMDIVFVGLDLGTSGLRAVALRENGDPVAQAAVTWPGAETHPHRWRHALEQVLDALAQTLVGQYHVAALSACSTSGTILALDQQGIPLREAWLYSDPRGQAQAQRLGIPSSWGLARWLWWQEQDPDRARHSFLAHPTDWVLQQLGGSRGITDHTSALKSGFDLVRYQWPTEWLLKHGLDPDLLPQVVAPGTVIGYGMTLGMDTESDRFHGLGSSETLIVAGLTDGCAAQLAAGAAQVGQVSTSLGTTLIFKATSSAPLHTPDGSVYAHLHPDRDAWLVGAASSTGGGILRQWFPHQDLAQLDQAIANDAPTGIPCYPLPQPGERFPVADPDFLGCLPQAEPGSLTFYRALLEGIACIERFGLERLVTLGIRDPDQLLTTGGASVSAVWLSIRASVLARPLVLSRYPQPAVGAAMVAAAGYWGCGISQAVERLWQPGQTIWPTQDYRAHYQDWLGRLEATSAIKA